MSTPRIYSSCLRCERLERELEAARKVILAVQEHPGESVDVFAALLEYERIRAEIESKGRE